MLSNVAEVINDIMEPPELSGSEQVAFDILERNMADRRWRLDNLYMITDEKGNKIKFKMNLAQRTLLDNMWFFNIILKARQLGFTTFICILFLDTALFRPNTHCGIIAHTRDDAEEFFTNKVRFAYDNLPVDIREIMTAPTDSTKKLAFSNGSSIRVGTSLRSGTFYMLHISEFGKICARWPAKAQEIVTGGINTVHAGQFVFIESTAEGRQGYFFEFCMKAMKRLIQGAILNKLQFKFHFFPWWKDPKYAMDENVVINQDMVKYFEELEGKGIKLSRKQKNWYVAKHETQQDDMMREYPSTPQEAFNASIIGAYYASQMTTLRKDKRLTKVPYDPLYPVNVFWDIGYNDNMALWFHQRVGIENRLIRYFEGEGEGLQYYVDLLQKLPYIYGTHYMPHDGRNHSPQTGKSFKEYGIGLGLRNIVIIQRALNPEEVHQGIQATRNFLGTTWIDEELCDDGIKCLDNYRKEWDKNLGEFKKTPHHDWACLPKGVDINTPQGSKSVEEFVAGDDVIISGQVAKVLHAQQVGEKEIVELSLPNRVIVRCSAEHKIFTSKGLVQAQHIEPGMVLLTEEDIAQWSRSSLGIREAFTESSKELNIVSGQNGEYMSVKQGVNKGCSTENCGSLAMVRYQKHLPLFLSQITGIISRLTTGSVGLMQRMADVMRQSIMVKSSMELCSDTFLKPGTMDQNQQAQPHSCNGMSGNTSTVRYLLDKLFTMLILTSQTMISAICNVLHRKHTHSSTQTLKVLSVKRCPAEPVFDIEVDHHHAYVLSESNVVTSNSNGADSLRCGAIGFKHVIAAMEKDLYPEYAEDI